MSQKYLDIFPNNKYISQNSISGIDSILSTAQYDNITYTPLFLVLTRAHITM